MDKHKADENGNILEVQDLVVEYRTGSETVHAVNGVTFSLERGKTLGLVGETGAGKTTLALSIMKLLPKLTGRVAGGSIRFNGRDLTQTSENEMRLIRGGLVSMIFQDPMTSLNPVIAVGEQIAEVLAQHTQLDKKGIEAGVDQLLALVGIPPERKNEYPHQFSGGMKQRIMIAIALACDPQLLLADEPTTALDVTIQSQILDMMEELKQKFNTTIIFITHDLGVVAEFCDYVAVMYAGEIVEIGTAQDVYESGRRHPYTVGLFQSVPNLEVDSDRLKPVDGLMPDPVQLPAGCKFHPRCPHCMDRCRTQVPEDKVFGTHKIKCHLDF
ncbi:MAG: ABC transporter ATP-binding protein [Oscillospiraceae bacterium]|nr:ABC transporter ATP-binding protein [Oscillospiraceae bacterium]